MATAIVRINNTPKIMPTIPPVLSPLSSSFESWVLAMSGMQDAFAAITPSEVTRLVVDVPQNPSRGN